MIDSVPAPWIAPQLQHLRAVAAAVVDISGGLVEANAGFAKLLSGTQAPVPGASVSQYFIAPDFATLAGIPAAYDGEVYHGPLTIGVRESRTWTLPGRMWRHGDRLRLLAEHDVEECERLYERILVFNNIQGVQHMALVESNQKLQKREAESRAASLTDSLTGLANRRCLEEALTIHVAHARRTGRKLCALMGDLDSFKLVNDTFGHDAGDRVLVAFAEVMNLCTRATDLVARFGGEEFVVLTPETDLRHAIKTADRIRTALEQRLIEPVLRAVTVSFGVAELAPGEDGDALTARADQALLLAKQRGRNQVVSI